VSAATFQQLQRCAAELRQLERELVEQGYVRRADGAERVREALRRVGEIGSPAGIVARAAAELGAGLHFDLVLIGRLRDGRLVAQTLWPGGSGAGGDPQAQLLAGLRERPLELRYPLVEHDVANRHEAALVDVRGGAPHVQREWAAQLGLERYVVAPIVLEGRTVGLVHAGAGERGFPVDEVDRELAALYCAGLGLAFERAMLREQIARQQRVIDAAIGWMNAQRSALSAAPAPEAPAVYEQQVGELLTARELEVMRLVAQGRSNREIATALVLGEGTVKYHVKNILRKLRVRTRSEAISRFAAMRAGAGEP